MGLAQAAGLPNVRALPPGEYLVEYNDRTHLNAGEWASLALITVDRAPQGAFPIADVAPSYQSPWYQVRAQVRLPDRFHLEGGNWKASVRDARRVVEDNLAQAFLRTGLLRPSVTAQTLRKLHELTRGDSLLLIPDTNALANGTLHWLSRSLTRTRIWVMVTALSVTQIQRRDSQLHGLARQSAKVTNLAPALRSRALVHSSLRLLARLRPNYQELPVAPALLRYVQQAGRASADPDPADVLEDRLLIEAIHAAIRPVRTHAPRYGRHCCATRKVCIPSSWLYR